MKSRLVREASRSQKTTGIFRMSRLAAYPRRNSCKTGEKKTIKNIRRSRLSWMNSLRMICPTLNISFSFGLSFSQSLPHPHRAQKQGQEGEAGPQSQAPPAGARTCSFEQVASTDD